jgi:hypothetical protein
MRGIEIDTVAQALHDDPEYDNGVLRKALKLKPNAIKTRYVRDFDDLIIRKAGRNKISVLRVFGHGMPGEQNIGGGFEGKKVDVTPAQDRTMCIKMVAGRLNYESQLKRLTKHFAPDAVVQLHGCKVGAEKPGVTLCRALAKLWNVPVCAAIDPTPKVKQFPQKPEEEDYEGRYMQVMPNGHVIAPLVGTPVRPFPIVPEAKAKKPLITIHRVGSDGKIRNEDCLSSIAKVWYKDALLWPIIFDHNKSKKFDNPNKLTYGQLIEVPNIEGFYTAAEKEAYRKRGLDWR